MWGACDVNWGQPVLLWRPRTLCFELVVVIRLSFDALSV